VAEDHPAPDPPSDDPPPVLRVPPWLDRAAAISWRFLVVAAAILALVYLLVQLQTVVLPLLGAAVLSTILMPVAERLRARGLRPLPATALTFLAFLGLFVAIGFLIVPSIVDEFSGLGPTLEDATQEIEDWLVQDAPIDVSRQDIEDAKQSAEEALDDLGSSSTGAVIDGALLAVEVVAGILLGMFLAFFFVKDGPVMQRWALQMTPTHHQPLMKALARRAWSTLGGYVRGTALFGLVESLIFGVSLFVLGADLILPVMVITFLAPFLPFIGAILSGIVATLVVLVTAGTGQAAIMAVIAVGVQQLDNEVLNPLIYGRAVRLHPVVIVLAITSGAALGGLVGAIIAVPVAAILINVLGEYREQAGLGIPTPDPDDDGSSVDL